jgi:hypothetical protein
MEMEYRTAFVVMVMFVVFVVSYISVRQLTALPINIYKRCETETRAQDIDKSSVPSCLRYQLCQIESRRMPYLNGMPDFFLFPQKSSEFVCVRVRLSTNHQPAGTP